MRHPVNRRRVDDAPFGQRAAEAMAHAVGSWGFLITQSCLLAGWIALNVLAYVRHWDPYPFILLNLALSFQAAFTGPILLIASNRSEVHQREIADATYADTELLKQVLEENTALTREVHALTTRIAGGAP